MTVSLSFRGWRGLGGGILAGILSAGLFVSAYTQDKSMLLFFVCFLLSYFTAVPLFVTGLGAGVGSCIAAVTAGVVVLGIVNFPDFALPYAVLCGLPAVGLTALALHQNPITGPARAAWGGSEKKLLTAITLYPCVVFLVVVVAMIKYKGGFQGFMLQAMNDSLAPLKNEADPEMYRDVSNAMQGMVQLAPALTGCSWILLMLMSLVVAQSALKKQSWNLRPDFALMDVSIPNWLIFAVAATGLAALLAPAPYDYVGINLCILLCVPFFLVGLAIVHAWAATTKAKKTILFLFYLTLTLLMLSPLLVMVSSLLVTALGAVDQWYNFRRRLAGRQQGG
jgi:hypothetical protein